MHLQQLLADSCVSYGSQSGFGNVGDHESQTVDSAPVDDPSRNIMAVM